VTIVDLQRYPIDDPGSEKGRGLVAETQRQVRETGACHMPGFLSAEGLAACLNEAQELTPLAHFSNRRLTPYYRPLDTSLPPDNPRNMAVIFAVGYVARDDIPSASPLRALYEGATFLEFLRRVLPTEPLYRYSEPRGSLNVTVMRAGDELGWHFDACEFVASILLRASTGGGAFEYVRDVRSATDANEAGVAAVLNGATRHARRVVAAPGDLVLFRGRHALHRVTPITGDTARLIALMSFDNVEQAPANPANETLMRPSAAT